MIRRRLMKGKGLREDCRPAGSLPITKRACGQNKTLGASASKTAPVEKLLCRRTPRSARRQLLLQRIADGCGRRRPGSRFVLRDLLPLLLLHGRLVAQADAPRFRANLDDFEVVL